MPDAWIDIKCLEIEQPIGVFYIGVMDADALVRISYADVRRLEQREVETYLGIERPLSRERVKEIRDYAGTVDATFPTGVILAVDSDDVHFENGVMSIRDASRVARIIDGQHRIAGLEGFTAAFQVNVVIFIDMDIEDQAMVFATINLAQTKVSKSLVYDLYEYTKTRSPTKTCHNIARLLNSREDSPFYKRIKILGRATDPHQPLTQAAFVEAVQELISGDHRTALRERDLMKRDRKLERAPVTETKRVLRNMFIDNKDAEIARLVWNYFDAVRRQWPAAWSGIDQTGNVLPRTNGFKAFMRFFASVYLRVDQPGAVTPTSSFLKVFEKIGLQDADFNTDAYPPGMTGESRLYRELEQRLRQIAIE